KRRRVRGLPHGTGCFRQGARHDRESQDGLRQPAVLGKDQTMRTAALRVTLCCFAAVLGLSGCATAIFNPVSNAPWTPGLAADMGAPVDVMQENSIVLTFSGGGLRAAAFAHGVLAGLEDMKTANGDLLGDVAMIGSVSGSSLTSAYYGLYGRK